MITDIKAKASVTIPVVTGEADLDYVRMSRLGALFTADWKQQLIVAGLAWSAHVGALTASAATIPVVGGGNGTTIDSDQPELCIGVAAGYYLIPMEAHVAVYSDNTDNGIGQMVLFADRVIAPVEGATSGTTVVPVNLLDGGAAFPGTCYQAVTANLTTTPVMSELLDYEAYQAAVVSGATTQSLKMDYVPTAPSILAGPCQIILCWGGTAALTGMGVIKVACVPTSYFPTS